MSLKSLIVRITGDKSGLDNTLKGAEGSLNSFSSVVKKVGGFLAAAFAIDKIKDFVTEVSKLAIEAEAAEKAFAKLGNPAMLSELKKATRGMLDDSDLMALAVKADNFGISLIDLAGYMKFATDRAILMNKPVADFVELMITGVGRESSRALTQLGVSVSDLKNNIKETGSFTAGLKDYMSQAFKDMGEVSDTTATKMQQISVSWTEIKEGIGKAITQSKAFQGVLSQIKQMLDDINGRKVTPEQKGQARAGEYLSGIAGFGKEGQKKDIEKEIAAVSAVMQRYENERAGLFSEKGILPFKSVDRAEKLKKIIEEYRAEIEALTQALKYLDEVRTTAAPEEKLEDIKNRDQYTSEGYKLRPIQGRERGPNSLSGFVPNTSGMLADVKPAYDNTIDQIERMTKGLYDSQKATDDLTNAFQNLFQQGSGGFQAMVNSMIQSLQRLVAEILAKKVVMLLVQMLGNRIIPGLGSAVSGGASAIGNTVGSGAVNAAGNLYASGINVNVTGKIAGSTILLAAERAASNRNTNT